MNTRRVPMRQLAIFLTQSDPDYGDIPFYLDAEHHGEVENPEYAKVLARIDEIEETLEPVACSRGQVEISDKTWKAYKAFNRAAADRNLRQFREHYGIDIPGILTSA